MAKEKESFLSKDFKIMIHFLKLCHKISQTYIVTIFISSFLRAVIPFINILMPKFIIDEIMGEKRINILVMLVLFVAIGNGILNLINRWIDTKVSIKNIEILNGFDAIVGEKIMNMDFENIEDPYILDLKEKAIYPITNQNVINRMINSIVELASTIITIIGLTAIIATINILIVGVILAIVLLNLFIYKKSQDVEFKLNKELIPVNRKFGYYINTTANFSIAKDFRLYNIVPLMMEKIEAYMKVSLDGYSNLFIKSGKYKGISKVNLQLQMIVIYGYMAYKVCRDEISIGAFTMYVSSAISFATNISRFLQIFIEFRQVCKYLDLYLEFQSIESSKDNGGRPLKDGEKYTIEFKNVYFKYPRAKEYVLKNISVKIEQGEKIAIVGENGSGKTTFIKLLSRLYKPTEGEILLNGTSIYEYSYDEYIKFLSVVFQDFKLLAFSIKENIGLNNSNEDNEPKILEAIKEAGLYEDVQKLRQGMDTSIYKYFDKEGIELSGGQGQKVAIARAVFKDAPLVILDEPTAALDPIGEFEIYSKFNELSQNKTAIYISHRLSSSKFCSKIFVFNKGQIVEEGSHEELLKINNGKYNEMYRIQAQYYI